jgi:hypothetical protein
MQLTEEVIQVNRTKLDTPTFANQYPLLYHRLSALMTPINNGLGAVINWLIVRSVATGKQNGHGKGAKAFAPKKHPHPMSKVEVARVF